MILSWMVIRKATAGLGFHCRHIDVAMRRLFTLCLLNTKRAIQCWIYDSCTMKSNLIYIGSILLLHGFFSAIPICFDGIWRGICHS